MVREKEKETRSYVIKKKTREKQQGNHQAVGGKLS